MSKEVYAVCDRCGGKVPDAGDFVNDFFWKDNKKRVGDVCERRRNEVDDKNARRRKGRSGSNVVGR